MKVGTEHLLTEKKKESETYNFIFVPWHFLIAGGNTLQRISKGKREWVWHNKKVADSKKGNHQVKELQAYTSSSNLLGAKPTNLVFDTLISI